MMSIVKKPAVKKRQIAMNGKVVKRRLLRPNLSIVYHACYAGRGYQLDRRQELLMSKLAGIAKTKMIADEPQEASKACWFE